MQDAETIWKNWCFKPQCKQIRGFPWPLSKGRALAQWSNDGLDWRACLRRLEQTPDIEVLEESVDSDSYERMKNNVARFLANKKAEDITIGIPS